SLREKYGRPRVFLGSGANGNCYTVTRLEDNKVFAIKAFRSRHRGESEKAYMKKLSSEFCIGSMLHHPNVVETHDLILDKDHAYEVLELCPNGDLYTFIQRSAPLAMSKVTSIFVQLIHGVAYLHSTGVVHRDLKPENCLFDKDGTLKIIDFGSADVWHLPFEEPGKCRMSTGRCGSGPYIAPEEWLTNQGYDGRKVDVWACAIIFMALAVRRFPWSLSANSDPDYARYKKYTEKPQSDNLPKIFTALKPEPDGPRNLILKMLEPNPNKRISIEEVMKDPWFIEVE
ncbi:kinase-like domain-containing protein, partial [Gaertneriomyces semiglobifer]